VSGVAGYGESIERPDKILQLKEKLPENPAADY
jgi:hypothetical protein